jgi:hypothetical protein
MTTDFEKVSLDQGNRFNNYKEKITNTDITSNNNVEGFNLLEERQLRDAENINVTKRELDTFNQMKDKFESLLKKYKDVNNIINEDTNNNIERTKGSNPYLGKNIRFTTQEVCYVTKQGVVKLYKSIDLFNKTAGKNGCPKNNEVIKLNIPWVSGYNKPGVIIPTIPPLITGTPMTLEQACGFEGTNVYATRFTDNIDSSYFGCYRNNKDIEQQPLISIIPNMSNANIVGNYKASASSIYNNDNNLFGPWLAFTEDKVGWRGQSFWHSATQSNNLYDPKTGIYKGSNSVTIIDKSNNSKVIKGEFLIVETLDKSGITLSAYSILPRQDGNLFFTRSPNTWYILGRIDGKWYEIDYRSNVKFDKNENTYYISNISNKKFNACMIITTVVGNSDRLMQRYSVQITSLKLFAPSPSSSAMENAKLNTEYTTFDNCRKYAYENNFRYFGLNNYNKSTGLSTCVVTNDLTKSLQYGDASKIMQKISIWSTNTSGTPANQLYITAEGRLTLINTNDGTIYWQSPEGPRNCKNGGSVDINSIKASYGVNCNGFRGIQVNEGNVTNKVKTQLTNPSLNTQYPNNDTVNPSYKVYSSNSMFGDPAPGCMKGFSISYSCGDKSQVKNLKYGEGSITLLDCNKEVSNCQFSLNINDDGNMVLTNDDKKSKTLIWSSKTSGQSVETNPKMISSKGKFGKNFIKNGESLSIGEWIGSPNGRTYLKLEKDGNLVLYTTKMDNGCVKKDNITYGTTDINGIYQINNPQNQLVNFLGKFAYIDEDSNLREYSGNILTNTDKYIMFEDYDSPGNDLQRLNNVSLNEVIDACNKNRNCGGFLYSSKSKYAFLKNKNMFPKGRKTYIPNAELILGVKKFDLDKNSACNKNTTDITASMLKQFKRGQPITNNTQCYSRFLPQQRVVEFDKIKNEMSILGREISDKMQELYKRDNNIHNKLGMNKIEFDKNLEMYKNIEKIIRNKDNLSALEINDYFYNIEGMQNLNDDDISGMLEDSELRLLRENYSYYLWTILAVGSVAAALHVIKK